MTVSVPPVAITPLLPLGGFFLPGLITGHILGFGPPEAEGSHGGGRSHILLDAIDPATFCCSQHSTKIKDRGSDNFPFFVKLEFAILVNL